MKALRLEQYGPPQRLALREVPVPSIADDQVLVRVAATSVNPADWYLVTGPLFARVFSPKELLRPKRPGIGSDLAGHVEAVGKEIRHLKVGDEVFGTSGAAWAEHAPAREVRLALKPANLSFEEAAAVPIAGITALQALRDHGKLQPGQRVLINGASGGVGSFAVQLAKAFGASVTAVCSTRNVEQVRSLGADRVVDYTEEEFTELGERHDLLIDIAGTRSLRRLRRVLTPSATVVIVGAKPKPGALLGPLGHVIRMRLAALGRSQKAVFFIAKINPDDLGLLARMLEEGTLKSLIDRRYEGLEQVRDALAYLGEGHCRSKAVVSL